MRLKFLVDMNLTPQWVPVLQKHGWVAVHWSSIGDPGASDREIMDWARNNQHVVFTHDLDFGAMLAHSHETGPSVLQVRTEDTLPDSLEELAVASINQHEANLSSEALVVVDESRNRVRVLPI